MKEFWRSDLINKGLNPSKLLLIIIAQKQPFSFTVAVIPALMLLFTLSCGKVEVPVTNEEDLITRLEIESIVRFKLYMKDLEDYCDYLAVAIRRQNWKEIRKYAMMMKNTSPVVLTGRRKEELPVDYVTIDNRYHLSTLKLIEAVEAREMDQLNIEYEKVKQTCDDCHHKYKKD